MVSNGHGMFVKGKGNISQSQDKLHEL